MRAILMPSDDYLEAQQRTGHRPLACEAHKPGAEPKADAKQLEPAVIAIQRNLGGDTEARPG